MKLPEFWRQWIGTVIGGIAGEILGFLFLWLALGVPPGRSVGAALLFALLCATLGHQLRFIPEIRAKIEETFEKRMNQIIEFAALGTQNGYFERHLGKMREQDLGNLRWVVAKFISYKLNKDFSNLGQIEIHNIPAPDYSKLLGSLIKECSESIYFTCPYTPTKWFVKLGIVPCKDSCGDSPFCSTTPCRYSQQWDTSSGLKKEHLPEHVKAICESAVPDKKRVVNIPKAGFGLLERNNDCFRNFLNYEENNKYRNIEQDDKIKVRFVVQEDLDTSIEEKYKESDYNILDNQIVIKWEEDKCILVFDRAEIEKHLRIFENIDASPYKKVGDIPRSRAKRA